MTSWLIWAFLLVLQNASHTAVSRARNSKSLGYHAIASVFSNGVWFLALAVAVDKIREADSALALGLTALFYVACTVVGSVGAHHLLMHHVEKRRGL
jgi:hypothetical protein